MPIIGTIASSRQAASSYTLIAENRLLSNTASVTFSSIPNTYAHLELWLSVRTTKTNTLQDYVFQFNGDTSASYRLGEYWVRGSQTAPSALSVTSNLNYGFAGQGLGDTAGANFFAASLMQINDYASTNKYKTTDSLTGNQNSTDGFAIWYSNVWEKTSAINSITIYPTTDSFKTNCYFTLFGVGA